MNRIFTLGIILITSCTSQDRTINIYSHQFEKQEEKLKLLKKYLQKQSGILDAEYHIWYQDNSAGRLSVPGPSDYNLIVALKIIPDSLDSWIKGLQRINYQIHTTNWNELKLDKNKWRLKSLPEFYHSSSKTEVKLVYRKEAVVLGIYSSMPVSLDYVEK